MTKRDAMWSRFAGWCCALVMVGCNLTDDQPAEAEPMGDSGEAACLAAANENQEACIDAGMQWIAEWGTGGGNVVLIDDPDAAAGVGGGVLVNVDASADWVGNYSYGGGQCTLGCGWCQPGQSLCYKEIDAGGHPTCLLCLDAGIQDQAAACADYLLACQGIDPSPDPDSSGGGEPGGADSTGASDASDGAGGADSTGGDDGGGVVEYDCSGWDPRDAVLLDRGIAYVDVAVAGEIADGYGNPLALCDDTRFVRTSTGHYAVSRMSSLGIVAQLGLRPGDVILSVDGRPLRTLDAIAHVAVELFYGGKLTRSFTLAYQRGRAIRQLRIVIE